MGLLDKVKGILFDEEEVEIPEIKKDPKKNIFKKNTDENEDLNPIKEIKIPEDDFKDSEYKSESTFTFPIDFEDEETIKFDDVDVKKEDKQVSRPIKEETYVEKDFTEFLNKTEDKKKFKPTPIISPVYGVLDQNYKKEDVIVRNDVNNSSEPTLESVRKKAFGSLEEDLEENLMTTKEIKVTKKSTKTVKKAPKDELEPVDKLKTIGELINEEEHSLDIPQINSINEEDEEYNIDSKEVAPEEDLEEKKVPIDSSDAEIDDDEADLFSLIDSMYEEKGE